MNILYSEGGMISFATNTLNAWTGEPIKRTKQSHPYSYEPFTVFGKNTKNCDGAYSDRLFQWDYEKYNKCCEEVWGNQGQYFGITSRTPETIEKFLQLYYDDANITLTWIVEYCNASSGYPVWYFQFNKEKQLCLHVS